MILAATGHRPDKLGGYSPDVTNRLRLFAHQALIARRPTHIISGMALGWDQAVASAALLADIPFCAAVPFEGQESKWPAHSQRIYRELLAQAEKIDIICPGRYAPEKMQIRNEWMVNQADAMLALWNGSPGGTANCVAYANEMRRPVENLWGQWFGTCSLVFPEKK